MGRRHQQQALQSGPPAELTTSQQIGKVETINGNNIYTVTLPHSTTGHHDEKKLVELPPKFRNTMWIRRGGYVLIDLAAFEGRENKLAGEIVTVIHDEKSWRKMDYWPAAFTSVTPIAIVDEDQDDLDSLSGPGNLNRRRVYDSSDED